MWKCIATVDELDRTIEITLIWLKTFSGGEVFQKILPSDYLNDSHRPNSAILRFRHNPKS